MQKHVRDEGKIQREASSFSKRKRKISRNTSSSEEDEPLLLRRKKEKLIWNERCNKEKKQRRVDSRTKKCELILHRLKVPDAVTHGALLKKNNSRNSKNPYMVKTWLRSGIKVKLLKHNDLKLKDSQENDDNKNRHEKNTISRKLSSLLNRNDEYKSPKTSSEQTPKEIRVVKIPLVKREKGKVYFIYHQ